MFKKIDEIKTKYDLNIDVFGQAADGNLHPTINTNMRDENEVRKTEYAMEEIYNYAIELGGTLSGKHGIGVMKEEVIKKEMGEARERDQQMIKKALDHKNILNPGKIFPAKGEERLVLRNE